MSEGKKGSLPHGWIVQTSQKYPDRVYYFNTISGCSTWECPILTPPKTSKEHQDPIVKKNAPISKTPPIRDRKTLRTDIGGPGVADTSLKQQSLATSSTCFKRFKSSDTSLSSSLNSTTDSEVDMPTDLEEFASQEEFSLDVKEFSVSEDIEMLDVSADLTRIKDLTSITSYYLIVDTNILISDLPHIDEIKDTPIEGCGPPHIFIPWVVFQELDTLKNSANSSTSSSARKAVRYLHTLLKAKHPRLHGQSPQEAKDWAKSYSKCNDDRILECCMSLADKMPREKVILWSNDKNLINKAMIIDVVAHDWESLTKALKSDVTITSDPESPKESRKCPASSRKNIKMKKTFSNTHLKENPANLSLEQQMNLEEILSNKRTLCTTEIDTLNCEARNILKEVLLDFLTYAMDIAYGEIWLHFKIDTSVLKGILDAFLKYWKAVFHEFFSDKEHRHFQLLLQIASRPEGFLMAEKECLSTLTAIEDIFHKIKNERSSQNVPIKRMEAIRGKCTEIYTLQREVSSSLNEVNVTLLEKQKADLAAVQAAFDINWSAISQFCGALLDFCDSDRPKTGVLSHDNLQHLLLMVHPEVCNLQQVMHDVIDAVENKGDIDSSCAKLYTVLNELLPSLHFIEHVEIPHFTNEALVQFCSSSENKERFLRGYQQVGVFHDQLEQAVCVMMTIK